MGIALSIAVYFICWWVVLFTILPIGMRTQQEEGEVTRGTPESAPAQPRIVTKMLITTGVSAVIFAIVYIVIEYKLIDPQNFPI